MRTAIPLTVLATALTCSLASAPANARARVFVASYGNDANPCTFGSPCKTFQQAVNVVDVGGEVTAIDSAGFGPISITNSVTITSPDGVEAGIVPVAGGSGITISISASAIVNLRGLTVVGATGNLDGILFSGTGTLNIQNCLVHGFGGDGIAMLPNGAATINIADTLVSNVNNNAVAIQTGGSGTVTATFTRVQAIGSSSGFIINGANSTGAVNATIANSTASNNAFGVSVESGSGGAVTQVMVSNTVIDNNGTGVFEDGVNSTTFLAKNTIAGNVTAFNVISSGALFSFNDNYIKSNGSDGGAISLVSAK